MKKMVSAPAPATSAQVKKKSAVPMLDLSRQYAAIRGEITSAIEAVCASQHYILGKEVEEFEAEAAAYLGTKESVGCASGTDAIWLALLASGVGPGDEVFTTPFSFFATASTIVRAGAKPIFVDVEPGTLNIDPAKIEARIERSHSAHLKAILPVHLYGQCANMDELQRIASAHKLALVEDAAQAFGAAWRGRRAGDLAPVAAFSFYPTKNLSCYGDGGLVTTSDPKMAEHLRRLRNHGSSKRYYHEEIGWNSRLDSVQAAILRVKLKYIQQWNAKRAERAAAYNLLLKSAGLLGSKGLGPVRLLESRPEAHHIYHQYVVRVDRRDELRDFLTSKGIGSEVYYPIPLHMQRCFIYLGYCEGDLPESEKAAREVLALPMFPELTAEEQAAVVNAISEFYS
ncbi:MAG TPA: DegT/DnrJ/EryC1/StrS family aminotransferase [Terriglobales bacterium]|nr:DegT/DnrJ/EryC1/StrS family aminotransferase [Terriglobales bacterium]